MLSSSIAVFGLSLSYYGVWFVIDAFRRFVTVFYLCWSDLDRQSGFDQSKYHIMVISILKNGSCKYFGHYIIKFVGFMSIHYAINLYII